jgi:hypothetical protein
MKLLVILLALHGHTPAYRLVFHLDDFLHPVLRVEDIYR